MRVQAATLCQAAGCRLQAAGCSRMPAGVLDGATHVYMANLCFPEALNHAMTTALAAVRPPLAAVARYLPWWR